MLILGIDPGATSGWVLYDSEAKRVLDAGSFAEQWADEAVLVADMKAAERIIERPMAYGPTRPQVVDCAWVAGILKQRMGAREFTRREVKKVLTEATNRDVKVNDDASAWAALVLLHGEGSDVKPTKKRDGGCIGRVTSHERAALALVVAWAIANGHWKP